MDNPDTASHEAATPAKRRMSADLLIGMSLIGAGIVGKVATNVSDGGLLAALGAR